MYQGLERIRKEWCRVDKGCAICQFINGHSLNIQWIAATRTLEKECSHELLDKVKLLFVPTMVFLQFFNVIGLMSGQDQSAHKPFSPFAAVIHTPWQTTHMGIPSASSHSPDPKGIVGAPPELASPCAPAELESIPLLRSLHSVIVSAMAIFVLSSTEMRTCRRRRTHSLNRRTHVQGSDQSSSITTNVSGTD